ncbi:YafY family protein [Longispora sp. NPDC051575]|uniref:helix-turn-helix transcriptional regulator n=1 Tax=Longispora sp. NPDC051575 TaxID=3154943 RepID=UPI0034186206
MLETSARLLRLLSLLQTPRDWTGPELADRLDVSTRTVRNDVERLRGLGYPVNATRGNVGGYRLGAGAAMPPLLLDDEEAVAIALGLRTAASGSITGIEESSLRALAKLEQVLPSRLRRRVNTLQSYTVTTRYDSGPKADAAVLTALTAACRDHERLRFDYADHTGATSVRSVEPYRLVNRGSRWYLVAYDLDRADWRTFRVDRLTPRIPTGPGFTPRDLPSDDLAGHVGQGVATATWQHRARITVHAPAAVVAERITPWIGGVEVLDEETCVLVTGAQNVETIAVYIGMLGLDFTVTEPPELVAQLRKLADRYGRSTPDGAPGPMSPGGDGG